MNRFRQVLRVMTLLGLLVFSGTVLSGCKTTPRVDWNTRIGTYTYDQAVAELGPPDKSARLSDGSTVAEWVIGQKPATGLSIGTGVGVFGGHTGGGVSVGQSVGGGGGPGVLRLIFDPENRLASWTRS